MRTFIYISLFALFVAAGGFLLLGLFALLGGLIQLFFGLKIWPSELALTTLWAMACFAGYFVCSDLYKKLQRWL